MKLLIFRHYGAGRFYFYALSAVAIALLAPTPDPAPLFFTVAALFGAAEIACLATKHWRERRNPASRQ